MKLFSGSFRFIPGLVSVSLIALIAGLIQVEASTKDIQKSLPKNVSPEVSLYLKDGSVAIGQILSMDAERYQLKTKTGNKQVPRKLYQGLVLNTPQERAIGEKISHDIAYFMECARYASALRERIAQGLPSFKSSCNRGSQKITYPLFHFQVLPDGRLKNIQQLATSPCAGYDQLLLRKIQSLTPVSLGKSLEPLGVLPLNYSPPIN